MNIVILGAGDIGSYLASILSKEEHNVTIIDKDAPTLAKLASESDVATIYGDVSRWKILDDLMETQPDLFIAMTGNDETNLTACSIAKNLGYPYTISRIKEMGFLSRSRLDFSRLFYVDHFIAAEILSAHDILKSIINPEDLAIENFAHGAIQMRTIIVPTSWKKHDIPLSELELPEELIISLIRRNISEEQALDEEQHYKEKIIFPHGDDFIIPGDEVTVIGETKMMYHLHEIFKTPHKTVQSVVIVGGTEVALHIGKILERLNIKVKIIEKEQDRCHELAELLPESTIINHDGADINFLINEQVQDVGVFIASTNEDRSNVFLSLLAKEIGCKKIFALISDISLAPVLREQNILFTVSERVNISNRILSIIMEKTVISIASLCDNQAKVIEVKVSPHSPLVGIQLSDLSSRLPKDLLIAAIENKGRVMIGKGNRIISPYDTIIVITSPENLHRLHEFF